MDGSMAVVFSVRPELLIWFMLACFFTALGCSQVGTFLVMRRMSLVGDAISHSVLPGIVVAFFIVGSLDSPWLLVGAGVSGVLATLLIELIHYRSRVRQDAATGIAFTSLFALGVLLIGLFAKRVDLDPDCVLFGQVEYLQTYPRVAVFGWEFPRPIVTMAVVGVVSTLIVMVLYRILLVSSFDPNLAASYRYRPAIVQLLLMALTSFVVVAAFQAVGAILVIALLILPGATGYLCANRLPVILMLAAGHALLSSVLGVLLALWLHMNTGAAVVMAGFGLFMVAWMFGPVDGVFVRAWRRRRAGEMVARRDDSGKRGGHGPGVEGGTGGAGHLGDIERRILPVASNVGSGGRSGGMGGAVCRDGERKAGDPRGGQGLGGEESLWSGPMGRESACGREPGSGDPGCRPGHGTPASGERGPGYGEIGVGSDP